MTTLNDRCDVHGAHSHTFLNPDGLVFKIGCFDAAMGAIGIGDESVYWTWFPGFAWQPALCRACFTHLGWHYRNTTRHFFGLIYDRLTPSGDAAQPD